MQCNPTVNASVHYDLPQLAHILLLAHGLLPVFLSLNYSIKHLKMEQHRVDTDHWTASNRKVNRPSLRLSAALGSKKPRQHI